jgi:ketosteroid isomerase-like protein
VNSSVIADRYFAYMHGRDLDGLAAMFSADAVVVLPDGREVTGLPAIRGMYQHIWGSGAPAPTPLAMVATPNAVAVEIEASLPDGTSRQTANFFHIGAGGRIARLSIYKRGSW